MDMAMKIGAAVLLLMMIIAVLPRVKDAVQNSPKGSANDWLLGAALLGGVAVFVYALTQMV